MYLAEINKTKEEMSTIIEYLGLTDIGFCALYDKGGSSIFFRRKLDNKEDWLLFSLNKNKHGFKISAEPTSWVSFPIVNYILKKAKIEQLNRWWSDEGHYRIFATCLPLTQLNITSKIKDRLEFYFTIKKGEIRDETSKILLKEIVALILDNILPTLTEISTLDIIDQQVIMKNRVSDLIPGEFGFKQMVIMKLCENPNYDSYISDYETRLQKGIEQNQEKYQPYLDFFLRLKVVLENYSIENI